MSTLQNQLAATEREETARAIRVLLRRPLLTREGDPEDYELVRRRRVAVGAWFESFLGWALELHPRSGHVRLLKVAHPSLVREDSRPARQSRSGVPFDRLRYVLTCVVAAELVRRRVVALGELAEAAVHACAADPELAPFETGRHAHRRAFVDAVLLLQVSGVLIAVEGRTEAFVEDERTAVLFQVEPAVLFSLLAAPVGASRVPVDVADDGWIDEAVDGLLEESTYGPAYRGPTRVAADDDRTDGTDGTDRTGGTGGTTPDDEAANPRRNLWLRHSALRAAFDDPVLHRDRLSPAQRAYLDSISGREQLRKAADTAGFVLEARAEGYLLVDPDRLSTDELFPADGATSVAALHLLTVLTREAGATCERDRLQSAVADLLSANRGWARTYQDDDGPSRLLVDALALLERHLLVAHVGDRVVARPAAFRYRDASIDRGAPRRPERARRSASRPGPATRAPAVALDVALFENVFEDVLDEAADEVVDAGWPSSDEGGRA